MIKCLNSQMNLLLQQTFMLLFEGHFESLTGVFTVLFDISGI